MSFILHQLQQTPVSDLQGYLKDSSFLFHYKQNKQDGNPISISLSLSLSQFMGLPPKLGSFHYTLNQKSKDRLLSFKPLHPDDFDDDDFYDDGRRCFCCHRRFHRASKWAGRIWKKARELAVRLWEFGRSDRRKIIFAAKMGLALSLISILIFYKEPSKEISSHSIWALLTVVVIFEFSIGSTLSKGFNRAIGTLSAGGLALGVAFLCTKAGEWEEVLIVISIFLAGSITTFIKLYPTMKPYEYGFRVFMLTFCIVMVSGNKTRQFIGTAASRFFLIAIGAAVGFGVNVCIYPIWAGEDLHNLVVKNFMGVAKSLEGCVSEYLQCVEYERVPSKILTFQASDNAVYSGYRSVLESTAQEDNLLGFAIWEPPHGPYKKFRYPWKNYVKVSGALRHCSFTVMALHGCILSEIQAPAERRQVFRNELQRVGTEGAKVLREIGEKIKTMRKLSSNDILYEVHEAAEELQKKIDRRSYLLVNSESWEIGGKRQNPGEKNDIFAGLNIIESERDKLLGIKSYSEAVLDLRSLQLFSKSWDVHNPSIVQQQQQKAERTYEDQISWPARRSFNLEDVVVNEEGCKTYESASALSLATFASLLIEFVARLQNVVNAFEELAEAAQFKDCVDEPVTEPSGLCERLLKLIRLK